MKTKLKFSIQLTGYCCTLALLDEKGREIFNLQDAIQAACDTYGNSGWIVFNGEFSEDRIPN